MHVLVTGGAGFIGTQIVRFHLSQGHRVHAVDDLSTGLLSNLEPFLDNPSFRFTEADVLTWGDLDRAATWANRIYHMAAVVGVYRVLKEPIETLAVNIAGCERVLRAVKASHWKPHVVIASTSEVYGSAGDTSFEEDSPLHIPVGDSTRWNYAVSKLADEAFGLSYAATCDIPVLVVRFFNVIGPGQRGRYGMVVPRFVEQAVEGRPLTVFGDGKQTRSFCDVRDVVTILDRLCEGLGGRGEVVNVGNDREISIIELAELVRRIAESDSPIVHVPYLEAYGQEFEDVRRRPAKIEKLRRLTGFEHEWTLERTIKDLVETKMNDVGVPAVHCGERG